MRAVVQRVSSASVEVDGETIGAIGPGMCALVGVTHSDGEGEADRLAAKLWGLRMFGDDRGLTNRSAADLALPALVVSQFTLYADTARGRRPSFGQAAEPERAAALIERLVSALRQLGARVETGRFGAHMVLHTVNDGPFTLLVEV